MALHYNSNKKIISNFLDITNDNDRRPFTNFLFNDIKSPIYFFDLKLLAKKLSTNFFSSFLCFQKESKL